MNIIIKDVIKIINQISCKNFTNSINSYKTYINKEYQKHLLDIKKQEKNKTINQILKEEKKLKTLFKEIELKKYKKVLNDLTDNKEELIFIYRWFRKLVLTGLDIGSCINIIRFFHKERERGYFYKIDEILNIYLQILIEKTE